ncbi:TetR family transcriptional regulator [Nocardia mexicana]|uniref:TetR family transcriptional regulator n=1 Tax=Nocardia mexicana TaxID=279262 RepID=A0A370H860_9NOCA|nr:TetR/AcrR family transcriptional regulator [Nocardia mexicana]RDI52848.1 TetR family transcriptional regulator [Nocardia mexicana]
MVSESEVSDRRLLRGARSRRLVTRRAADIASAEGLDGLSFGRLAEDLGLSKAGIQTLFRTKEQLQLATVAAAGEVFVEAVVRPSGDVAEGAARLRELIRRWLDYATEPVFPGGCFWGANLPEFDSRPGPVRDALARQHRDWTALIAREIGAAVEAGEVADLDPDLVAFQIVAVLEAANIALRLGDPSGIDKARRVADGLLGDDARPSGGQRTRKSR